ncbi:hypothetical protein DRO97_01685 [Archaeoglobales archaeon]|nr:MAG: hypothetical protein DRO97_01685 [Archaeoglobales archaeon]
MPKCEYCGKEVTLPFKCRYCGGYFCEDCYLPPKHDCTGIESWKATPPPSGIEWTRHKTIELEPKPKEKPIEIQIEEEQMSEDEKQLYLSLRKKFCYECGKPLSDEPTFICSQCNLSFCNEHRIHHDCIGYEKIKILPLGIKFEDIKRVCHFCGRIGEVYTCSFCGDQFCSEHKFPDDHRCKAGSSKEAYIDHGVITYISKKGKKKESPIIPEHKESIYKNQKERKSKLPIWLIVLVMVLGLAYATSQGYISIPTLQQTPISTPNLAEKIVISLKDYYFFSSKEISGVRFALIFKNENSIPVKIIIVDSRTASGLGMLSTEGGMKESIDEFTINSSRVVSREYFIPKAKLDEIKQDKLSMKLKIMSNGISQTKDVVVWFRESGKLIEGASKESDTVTGINISVPLGGGIKIIEESLKKAKEIVSSIQEELIKENSTIEDSKKAIDKINEIRKSYGRNPINFDKRAYNLALARAKDMVENEYFDHVNPKTGECAVSIRFKYGFNSNEYVAENIFGKFYGSSYKDYASYSSGIEEEAIESWMTSRGHRYNLLFPNHYAGAMACYHSACVFIGVNHDYFSDRCTTGAEGLSFWENAPKQPYEV